MTHLLPLLTNRNLTFQLVDQYNGLENETIRNLIPNMLVITVDSIYELYKYYSNQKLDISYKVQITKSLLGKI